MCGPFIDDFVDHAPVELAFARFQVCPGQADVDVVHAREFQDIRIARDSILVDVIVRVMVIPTLVRVNEHALGVLQRYQVVNYRNWVSGHDPRAAKRAYQQERQPQTTIRLDPINLML